LEHALFWGGIDIFLFFPGRFDFSGKVGKLSFLSTHSFLAFFLPLDTHQFFFLFLREEVSRVREQLASPKDL